MLANCCSVNMENPCEPFKNLKKIIVLSEKLINLYSLIVSTGQISVNVDICIFERVSGPTFSMLNTPQQKLIVLG